MDFARACSPGLDIVTQPILEIARCAVDLMLRRLSGAATPTETLILATSLQEGQSVQNRKADSMQWRSTPPELSFYGGIAVSGKLIKRNKPSDAIMLRRRAYCIYRPVGHGLA